MEDCCYDADGIMRDLIAELKQINSRDDLPAHTERLKQHFMALAQAIIEARKYKDVHPEEIVISTCKEQSVSDKLRIELNRILHMEGGREVLEKTQKEALDFLQNSLK